MTDLPSGTVTFLFTDIEGSTRLWEEHPEAMKRALGRHDAVLRAAIGTNRGHIFKTVGDAFDAVFPTAPGALAAALAAQRADSLAPDDVRVGARRSPRGRHAPRPGRAPAERPDPPRADLPGRGLRCPRRFPVNQVSEHSAE